jgi:nitroreductase
MNYDRLSMPIGEAMFTQRSIRRFRPDPIPVDDIRLILEAAVKAPNGGNNQIARFLVLTDRDAIRDVGGLYREAWWAKRRDQFGWTGPADVPPDHANYQSAMRLAEDMRDAPCMVLVLSVPPSGLHSVFPSAQNLMLAARALGIGSVPTRLHPDVMDRLHDRLKIPREVTVHFCIPLGYPQGNFGPTKRRPIEETCFFNSWEAPVPWAAQPV